MNDQFWKWFALALLVLLAAREFQMPRPGFAQSSPSRNLWIEPGTVDIPLERGGNRPGKVVIDLDTGDTFGYPVFGPERPYPGKQLSEDTALVSQPQYLGRFNLSGMRQGGGRQRPY